MKKILLLFIVLIAVSFVTTNYILVPKALGKIENYFKDAGFHNVQTSNVQFKLSGINIAKIKLDKGGFNAANNVAVGIFWPTYLFTPHIKSIDIKTLSISSTANNPNDILRYQTSFDISHFSKINAETISIDLITWDIATPKTALRIEGDLHLKQDGDLKNIKANLKAAQHELGFTSLWSGTIQDSGDYNVESTFNDLNINTNSFIIKRGTGWVTLESKSQITNINAQLDAGSGNILNIPTKNISFILNQENDYYAVLTRANASDIQSVNLYGDFKFSNDIKNQAFELMLEIGSPNEFISYLKQQNILKNLTNGFSYPSNKINIELLYEPENRFADGPFPFSLNVNKSNKNNLKGTFLIYPSNLDVRGTAQGDQDIINMLQTLFYINKDNISDKNIRFKENLKGLL